MATDTADETLARWARADEEAKPKREYHRRMAEIRRTAHAAGLEMGKPREPAYVKEYSKVYKRLKRELLRDMLPKHVSLT